MPATLHTVTRHFDTLLHLQDLQAHFGDSMMTLGLAAALLTAGVAVLALLPWTDEQIAHADAEARQLARQTHRHLVARSAPRVLAVPRSS